MQEVGRVLSVVAVLAVGVLSGASEVRAQEKGAGLAQQIQGSWVLVSMYNEQEGKRTEQFGSNPRGSLIFTPDGRFSSIHMRASLPKFASNSRVKGTAEENQAVVQGSSTLFGTYTVASDKEQTVNLHIEGSTFPNWDGSDQKRIMTVNGDELKVISTTATIGGTNYSVYKRATPVLASSEQSPPTSEQAKRIEAMVDKAAALAESQGKAAFSEFRKRDSEWWFGNTYLFAYDQNLNVLLNPAFPKREGTNPRGKPGGMLSGVVGPVRPQGRRVINQICSRILWRARLQPLRPRCRGTHGALC
jgi:hypothetical protein